MDKTQLKRHDLVYVSPEGKDKIWQSVATTFCDEAKILVQNLLQGPFDVPGFVRRSDEDTETIPIGFVPHQRIKGNRVRIAAFTSLEDIVMVMSPYDVMQRKAFAIESGTECIRVLKELYELAESFDLQVGVLGSAALELATGLPYTDEGSDIDLLIKPAPYEKLQDFYRMAKENFTGINMDFELDLPNGYGVKLVEVFTTTKTVLGKGLKDVNLLYRKDIMKYLV